MLDLHVLRMWMIIQRNISPVVVVAVFLLLFFSRSETALCLLSAALSYFNGAKATGGLPQISFDKDLRPFIFDIQITWKALRIYCLNCSCIYLFTRAFTLMFLYIFFTDMHHITEILSLI